MNQFPNPDLLYKFCGNGDPCPPLQKSQATHKSLNPANFQHGKTKNKALTKSKISNFKILSWNIQSRNCSSLGNKLDMSGFMEILGDHNIICLQETRRPIEIPNFTTFNSLRSETNLRIGGGVSISVHESLRKGVKEIRLRSYTDCISIKLDKNYFNMPKDIYITCCYVSPSSSTYRLKLTENPWDHVNAHITKLATKGDHLLCGDFNARTGKLQDQIEPTKSPANCNLPDLGELDTEMTALTRRNNSDDTNNLDGNALIELCIGQGLYILNGRTLGDIFGANTFYNRLRSSCIDYFIGSNTDSLKQCIKFLNIMDYTQYSDHCLIQLELDLPLCTISRTINPTTR